MGEDILLWNLFWLILLLFFIFPVLEKKYLELLRMKKIKELEHIFNAKVITMIHRMETLTFLGIPVAKFITVEDAESIIRAIRSVPENTPIVLILHTPGGIALAAQQIALALKKHKGKVTVVIPHYAMSGGTLIALAADEILMDENAVLGPIDPVVQGIPAVSILKAVKEKGNKAGTKYLILADIAEKAINQIKEFVIELLKDKVGEEKAKQVAEELVSGKYTHDYPITVEKLREWGLNVKTEIPKEVYELLELYPSPKLISSVEYPKEKIERKRK